VAGAEVTVGDLDPAAAPADLPARPLDVRSADSFAAFLADLGPLDVLVNNAGVTTTTSFLSTPAALRDLQIDVNLRGVVNGMAAALPAMVARGHGHVVNIASLAGRIPTPNAAIYSATGQVFATYTADGTQRPFPGAPAADNAVVDGADLLIFKRIVDQGRTVGTIHLRARYELYDRVRNYAGIALIVAAAAMLVALLVSSWLQKIVTRPILAIGEVARDVVAQGDYSRRAPRISDDEVGTLVDAFNNMLSEIERRTLALEASNLEKAREVLGFEARVDLDEGLARTIAWYREQTPALT